MLTPDSTRIRPLRRDFDDFQASERRIATILGRETVRGNIDGRQFSCPYRTDRVLRTLMVHNPDSKGDNGPRKYDKVIRPCGMADAVRQHPMTAHSLRLQFADFARSFITFVSALYMENSNTQSFSPHRFDSFNAYPGNKLSFQYTRSSR